MQKQDYKKNSENYLFNLIQFIRKYKKLLFHLMIVWKILIHLLNILLYFYCIFYYFILNINPSPINYIMLYLQYLL